MTHNARGVPTAFSRSVSFLQGTKVTYVTGDVPYQELELRGKRCGNANTHVAMRASVRRVKSRRTS